MTPKITYYIIPKYGYGDVLVGLVSTYLIAKHFNIKFEIVSATNVHPIFPHVQQKHISPSKVINLLNPESKKRALKLLRQQPLQTNQIIVSNQPWHSLLYSNTQDFIHDTRKAYKHIYTRFLVPSIPIIINTSKLLTNTTHPLLGIQVRCGDYTWNENYKNVYLQKTDFDNVVSLILTWIQHHGISQHVYLTSDNMTFLKLAIKTLQKHNIQVFHSPTRRIHFREADASAKFDTVTDHHMLSMCAQFLVSKHHSNYGFTAALVSGSNNIWTFNGDYTRTSRITMTKPSDLFK
jgi:hypothetical protein